MILPVALASALFCLLPTAAKGACAEAFLSCDDGQCVRREDWCDRLETCEDGSDEAYCGPQNWWGISPNKCNQEIHFRCNDGLCWPLSARCDGTADCKDESDENDCNLEEKVDSEEKPHEPNEIEDKSEETKSEAGGDKSEEIGGTDEEDESKESSEEENYDWKDDSEENGRNEKTTTTETPTTVKPSTASTIFYDYEYNTSEVSPEIITHVPRPKIDGIFRPEETIHATTYRPPTTQLDFYANKMKQRFSTQTRTYPTSAYHPHTVISYRTSRKPVRSYAGPTRPYTPRPYRYIGARQAGQSPSSYRGRNQPVNGPYYSPTSHYVPPQIRTNHRQQYSNLNYDNGRAGWPNSVIQSPRVYGRQLKAPSRFYFKKNYNDVYGRTNYPSVKRGVDWILSIRNSTGGWGKETPRALVALSLVNNSFLVGSYENDLMQKFFEVYLGVNLLRKEPVSLNRLAMFVNALIATCQNPRDFQGWDLTELIRSTILKNNRKPKPPLINPSVYLSLCLADRNLTQYEVHHLMTYLAATRNDEVTRDMTSLALEAFSCHMHKEKHNVGQFYSLQKLVWNATSRILQRMKEDGSFGSVYSTALVAKALMSLNDSVEWNPEPTFRFLKSHQQRNGSFGDFLATYHALPALRGRSLLHLRNTHCDPPTIDRELSPAELLHHPGPKSYIRYSLHLGSPLSTGHTVQLLLPSGVNFFDVMRVAAHENDRFKFSWEEVKGRVHVYSLSDLPNDPEEGLAWRLYVRSPTDAGNTPNPHQLYTGDIRELLPTPDQHVVFWYHQMGL